MLGANSTLRLVGNLGCQPPRLFLSVMAVFHLACDDGDSEIAAMVLRVAGNLVSRADPDDFPNEAERVLDGHHRLLGLTDAITTWPDSV